MSTAEKPDTTPDWVKQLRFHPGFADLKSVKDYTDAMEAWSQLPEGDRSFIQAHLTYLQVRAHGAVYPLVYKIAKMLGQLGELSEIQVSHLEGILAAAGGEDDEAPEDVDVDVVEDEPPVQGTPIGPHVEAAPEPAPKAPKPKAPAPAGEGQ